MLQDSSLPTIVAHLFETQALRVAPADEPFWYTSGLFGPYYINTHFLYGSEAAARELLLQIDGGAADASPEGRTAFLQRLDADIEAQRQRSGIFRDVVQALVEAATPHRPALISGGERRDFFFSIPVARALGLPHLSLFKDGSRALSWPGEAREAVLDPVSGDEALPDGEVLHIADLVTEGSSYTRAWIPFLAESGYTLRHSLAVVDRAQGGDALLAEAGVTLEALARFDAELFEAAAAAGAISEGQLEGLLSYLEGPRAYVRRFLDTHPCFLERMAARDEKTAQRVQRLRQLEL